MANVNPKIEKLEGRHIEEADLPGALDKPDQKPDAKEKDKKKDSADTKAKDEAKEDGAYDREKDYQLMRSVDLIHGLSLYGKHQ